MSSSHDALPTDKLAAIDLSIRLIREHNRHLLIPAPLSEIRSEIAAEIERDRAFGLALGRTGLIDVKLADLAPDVIGALVRAAVEITGHAIVPTQKVGAE